jgi:hypothetical protein
MCASESDIFLLLPTSYFAYMQLYNVNLEIFLAQRRIVYDLHFKRPTHKT